MYKLLRTWARVASDRRQYKLYGLYSYVNIAYENSYEIEVVLIQLWFFRKKKSK